MTVSQSEGVAVTPYCSCACPLTMPSADIVYKAQQDRLNAADAFDWYIDGQGRACLYNVLDFSFEQGLMSYALPRLFDRGSSECEHYSALSGVGTAMRPSALAQQPQQAQESGEVIYDAIPIPSLQNVLCSDDACGLL